MAFAAECNEFISSTAQVSDPDILISPEEFHQKARETKISAGLDLYAWGQAEFLCSLNPDPTRQYCLRKVASLLNQSLNCLNEQLTVKELRPLAWSYLRNPEIESLVLESLSRQTGSAEESQLQKNLWRQFQVLLLPGGVQTPVGLTKPWRIQDLRQLAKGFETLQQAVTHAVGKDRVQQYSHLWGAGLAFARLGELSISGQFGEIYSEFPLQINIVIDITRKRKSAAQVAQHLAHENSHSNDYLRGRSMTGQELNWSETDQAKIFEMCGLAPRYETPLFTCLKKHPTWFNFHPTNYSAIRSAEFYTKMLDEWVRENLGLSKKARPYRCQNESTLKLWREMEINLIGGSTSVDCR